MSRVDTLPRVLCIDSFLKEASTTTSIVLGLVRSGVQQHDAILDPLLVSCRGKDGCVVWDLRAFLFVLEMTTFCCALTNLASIVLPHKPPTTFKFELMHSFVADWGQSAADQPNNLAEGMAFP